MTYKNTHEVVLEYMLKGYKPKRSSQGYILLHATNQPLHINKKGEIFIHESLKRATSYLQ